MQLRYIQASHSFETAGSHALTAEQIVAGQAASATPQLAARSRPGSTLAARSDQLEAGKLGGRSTGDTHTGGSSSAIHKSNDDSVVHVALEYAIPHVGYNNEFKYGGLGEVGLMLLCTYAVV